MVLFFFSLKNVSTPYELPPFSLKAKLKGVRLCDMILVIMKKTPSILQSFHIETAKIFI